MTKLQETLAQLTPDQRTLLELKLAKKRSAQATVAGISRLIPRLEDRSAAPLSFSQERFWFLDQLAPGSPLYVIPTLVRLRGGLDPAVLERALRALVERHEALRTTFPSEGGKPVQRIARSGGEIAPPLQVMDLSAEEGAVEARRERAGELASEALVAPFDLAEGPLIRAVLVRVEEEEHLLALAMQHIVSDGWSMRVLVRDLTAFYQAFASGAAVAPLPVLEVQYADFAAWQRERLDGERVDRLMEHWRTRLEGAPPLLELPVDRSRPALPSYRGADLYRRVPNSVVDSLAEIARARGATLFMGLLAAFDIFLWHHTGQRDVIVGSPTSGREHLELEPVVGAFVNTLVLRSDLSGDPTFGELLDRVKAVVLDARDHQELPFERLVEELDPERNLSYNPLFQVMLTLQNLPRPKGEAGSWVLENLPTERTVSQLDFAIEAAEVEAGLDLRMEYSTDLFDRATAERMADRFLTVLASAVAAPGARLSGLPWLPEGEVQALLKTGIGGPAGQPRTLADLFARQVARTPDAVAVVAGDGEGASRTSYAELAAQAHRLAHHLRALGIGPEDRVGLCLERSARLPVALWGVLLAGAAYVPLDPSYPTDRLQTMVDDAGLATIVTEAHTRERHVALFAEGAGRGYVDLDADADALAERSAEAPEVVLDPSNLAYVIYTSGSTGKPKGVLVAQRQVAAFFAAMDERVEYEAEAPGTWLAVTGISFDISVLELLWTLCRGFRVVVHAEPDVGSLGVVERGGSVVADDEPALPAQLSTRELSFSLFYFASDENALGSEKYRLLLEGARFADRNGFEAVWTPERHFHAFGGLYPNPSVVGAAIAATTERISIRSGSVVLPLQNPLRVAEEWSVVDNLSNGRVGLSFASGWHADDFVLAPDRYANRHEILYRDIEVVRELWRGGSLTLPGGAGQDATVRIHPAPVQTELPIWVTAAGNPATFESAGRIGAGLLTHLLGQDLDQLAEKIRLYRQAWREGGHAGNGHVTLMLHTFVGEDGDEVRELVRGPFREYLRSSVGLMANLARGLGMDVHDLSDEDLEVLLDHAFDRYYQGSALFGTPAECLAMAERLKAIEVDEVGCLIDFGVETERALAALAPLDRVRRMAAGEADALAEIRPDAATTGTIATATFPERIVEHGVTHLQCTPSMARMLTLSPEGREALGRLRRLFVGGEALPEDLAETLLDLTSGSVSNMYGPTEATVWSTTRRLEAGEQVTLGSAIRGTRVQVVAPDLSLQGWGVPGELLIAGAGVTRGYHERPKLTAERFVPDAFADAPGGAGRAGERLYRTGDLVRRRGDGELRFLGRLDHQVKLRGHRIELGEIEALLAGHPGVRQAVVALRGEGESASLVAYTAADSHLPPALESPLDPEERAKILGGEEPFHLPNGMAVARLSDFQAGALWGEIFADDWYLRHGIAIRDGDTIFDVGANVGFFTLFAHCGHRNLKVHAFEPIPPTFEELRKNVRLYDLPAKLHNLGLSAETERASFTFYPEMAGLSGRYGDPERDRRQTRAIALRALRTNADRLGGRVEEAEIDAWLDHQFRSEEHECRLRRLSDVMREEGVEAIDLLKVDVERAELDVLAGIDDEDWPKIRQVVLEVDTREHEKACRDLLEARGFDVQVDDLVVVDETDAGSEIADDRDRVEVYMVYAKRDGLDPSWQLPERIEATPESLRSYLRQCLPGYMVPSRFVSLDRLPLTANGKVDRAALPAPSDIGAVTGAPYVEPKNELEKRLAAVWRSVLGLERLGRDDNFFEIGGNSLLMVQLRSRLRDELGRDISLVELFRHSSVARLARALESASGDGAEAGFSRMRGRAERRRESRRRQRPVRRTR